jgi:very-short-patch-repair endonuclease
MYRDHEQRDFARQLRNNSTPAETRLWHFLRAGKLGVKFRRQAAIGGYIVDFVCFSRRLIVELDGPQHVEDKAKCTTLAEPLGSHREGFE